MFDDMDTCYNCMYRFGSNEKLEESVAADGAGSPRAAGSSDASAAPTTADVAADGLLAEFLVELEGFLRQFLADRLVHGQQPGPFLGELAAVGAVSDEQLDP